MSRSYSNFLLLQDVIDNIPTTDPVMVQAVNILLSPIVNIVEEDCGTLLGTIMDMSLELEGLIYVDTGSVLTPAIIRNLLMAGKYRIGVRNIHSCNSYGLGGICRKCYQGSYIGSNPPPVGSRISLKSSLIYQTDIIAGNGYASKFTMSQTTDDYYNLIVLNQGVAIDPSTYTLGYDYIQFNSIIPLDSITGVYTVHFYQQNTEAFQGYISKTYSGALLGIQPLPTLKPLLRTGLYDGQFSDNFVSLMLEIIKPLRAIPTTYMEYMDRIHSRLEKVLFILYLYAIYSAVQV